ncbi:hypothetical protein [Bradyrhizobium sp. Ghvi]|uniref:hypothetical protein n=1 Tax=Bradyrhizobium sp. Ghvi TaxID=1855319 RepID=UPI0011783158|nr:hypothetical protein [Bradyrhizobium sp. Ghvi]
MSQIVARGSFFGMAERSASLECRVSVILSGACTGKSDLSSAAIGNQLHHSWAKCVLPSTVSTSDFADAICGFPDVGILLRLRLSAAHQGVFVHRTVRQRQLLDAAVRRSSQVLHPAVAVEKRGASIGATTPLQY